MEEDMSDVLKGKEIPEGLELGRASYDEILWKVSFTGDNFTYVADWTYEELERITRYESNASLPTKEELNTYFKSLTYLRVCASTGEKMPSDIRPTLTRRLFVPARFASILSMIGEVYYPDVAVRILPATNISAEEVFSLTELIEVSQKLEKFFEDGFCGTMGFSLDRYGDPHFMNKVAIIEKKPQNCIKSMTKDNPLYGFFAWIMNSELLEVAYSEARYLLRVNYSEPNIYNSVARRVWNKVEPSSSDEGKNNANPYTDGTRNILSVDTTN